MIPPYISRHVKQKALLLTFHFPEAGSGPVIAIVIVALIIVIVIVVAVVARAQGILCFAGELNSQTLSTRWLCTIFKLSPISLKRLSA